MLYVINSQGSTGRRGLIRVSQFTSAAKLDMTENKLDCHICGGTKKKTRNIVNQRTQSSEDWNCGGAVLNTGVVY